MLDALATALCTKLCRHNSSHPREATSRVEYGDLRHPCLCDFLSTVPVDVVMAKSNISVMLFNLHRSTSLAGVNFYTLHGNPVNHAILFCLVK